MFKLIVMLLIGAATVACVMFGEPAFAVVMAFLACFLAGLTAAIIGMLVGTNVFKINYETAFNRSFLGGTALVASVIAIWTVVLNLLSGGITADLVKHLFDVSSYCAAAAAALAVLTGVSWGVLVFGRRKSK